jgi:hypothetical protein
MVKEAGVPQQMMQVGSREFMNANGWGNPKHKMDGWIVVDTPRNRRFSSAPKKRWLRSGWDLVGDNTVIAANEFTVGPSGSHAANDNYLYRWWNDEDKDIVYRRYVGG